MCTNKTIIFLNFMLSIFIIAALELLQLSRFGPYIKWWLIILSLIRSKCQNHSPRSRCKREHIEMRINTPLQDLPGVDGLCRYFNITDTGRRTMTDRREFGGVYYRRNRFVPGGDIQILWYEYTVYIIRVMFYQNRTEIWIKDRF